MGSLGRRLFFALPVAAPFLVPAAAALASAPTSRAAGMGPVTAATEVKIPLPWREIGSFEIDLSELEPVDWCPFERCHFSPSMPRERDLAATLGVPYSGPREWTDEEVAATLGISTDAASRDRLIVAGWVAPDATPEQALDAFRAARPLLDGEGEG